MKKYKLTDQNMQTHNGFQWKLGEEKNADGKSSNLCNESWLHYYHSPLVAVLLNPIHVDIKNPRLFEVKALGNHLNDKGLKGGCTKMTLVEEIPFPEVSINQKTAFAVLCSLVVYKEESYVVWANNWLSGKNRTARAAYAAARAADAAYAAYAAARAAAAAYAAYAAARAAAAAAAAADAAAAAYAYAAAAYAYAAARAADAAARAAAAAAAAAAIDLIKIAKQALKYK